MLEYFKEFIFILECERKKSKNNEVFLRKIIYKFWKKYE